MDAFLVHSTKGHRRMWPLFLRAGAEIPVPRPHPYLSRVHHAGGFKRYEQAHLGADPGDPGLGPFFRGSLSGKILGILAPCGLLLTLLWPPRWRGRRPRRVRADAVPV